MGDVGEGIDSRPLCYAKRRRFAGRGTPVDISTTWE